jgi:hypothetical protein
MTYQQRVDQEDAVRDSIKQAHARAARAKAEVLARLAEQGGYVWMGGIVSLAVPFPHSVFISARICLSVCPSVCRSFDHYVPRYLIFAGASAERMKEVEAELDATIAREIKGRSVTGKDAIPLLAYKPGDLLVFHGQ